MKLLKLLIQSIRALLSNPVRSFLTVLAIIIGIGSVIALIALGNGVRISIEKQIQGLGPDIITIMPGVMVFDSQSIRQGNFNGGQRGFSTTSTLTVDDLNALRDNQRNPNIQFISGVVSGSGVFGSVERFGVSGVSPDYFQVRNLTTERGQFLQESDITSKSKNAVIGHSIADTLFPNQNPIGQSVGVQNDRYAIIGVLKPTAENAFNNSNNLVFIPYTSAFDTFETDKFNSFLIKTKSTAVVNDAKKQAESTLLSTHHIADQKLADFSVTSSEDLLSTFSTITGLLTSLLSGIAAISLLVGGIGIMNIMLVSVTERTREIGLRKAVGARMVDIASQFVIETMILTLLGGILGVGAGIGMARIAGNYIGFTPVTTLNSILLAAGISTLVGLLFGIYPAIRAARLSPIEALRYE